MKTKEQNTQLRNTLKNAEEIMEPLARIFPDAEMVLDMLHMIRVNLSWVLEDADWDKNMEDWFQNFITSISMMEKKR